MVVGNPSKIRLSLRSVVVGSGGILGRALDVGAGDDDLLLDCALPSFVAGGALRFRGKRQKKRRQTHASRRSSQPREKEEVVFAQCKSLRGGYLGNLICKAAANVRAPTPPANSERSSSSAK